jgi:hypothetical protein
MERGMRKNPYKRTPKFLAINNSNQTGPLSILMGESYNAKLTHHQRERRNISNIPNGEKKTCRIFKVKNCE